MGFADALTHKSGLPVSPLGLPGACPRHRCAQPSSLPRCLQPSLAHEERRQQARPEVGVLGTWPAVVGARLTRPCVYRAERPCGAEGAPERPGLSGPLSPPPPPPTALLCCKDWQTVMPRSDPTRSVARREFPSVPASLPKCYAPQ